MFVPSYSLFKQHEEKLVIDKITLSVSLYYIKNRYSINHRGESSALTTEQTTLYLIKVAIPRLLNLCFDKQISVRGVCNTAYGITHTSRMALVPTH